MAMNKFKLINCFSSLIFLSTSLFSLTSSSVRAESVLEEINRTGVLKVGIRDDVIPFGFRDINGKIGGICFDLVDLIRNELTNNIQRDIISTKLLISGLNNRFEIVDNKLVHLECGPNTIREIDNYQVTFSQPFFISGVRFIANEELAKKFVNSEGKDLRIGLLRYTSTEKLVREKYPQAEFEYFQGERGSLRALQSLRRGQIDGFADDTILLIGESLRQKFPLGSRTGFVLTPTTSLSCELYGFILPVNNQDWVDLINSVIQSPQTQKVFQDWFENFPTESFDDFSRCSIDG